MKSHMSVLATRLLTILGVVVVAILAIATLMHMAS